MAAGGTAPTPPPWRPSIRWTAAVNGTSSGQMLPPPRLSTAKKFGHTRRVLRARRWFCYHLARVSAVFPSEDDPVARKRDKHDKHDMAGIIGRSPGQFEAGLTAAAGVATARGPFRNVLVAGMGGSWMAAALVAEAGLARVPIRIHRSYDLPEGLDRSNTLVIASSFSGSTEETLSAYDAARKGRFRLVGIASGGELLARCEHDGVPFVRIPADPPDMQPRCATGYGVGILVGILARRGHAGGLRLPAVCHGRPDLENQAQRERQDPRFLERVSGAEPQRNDRLDETPGGLSSRLPDRSRRGPARFGAAEDRPKPPRSEKQ